MANEHKNFYLTHKDNPHWVLGWKGSSAELFFSPHTAAIIFFSERQYDGMVERYPWIKELGVRMPSSIQ